jgi:uncharacterized protein (TIGR02246 family)
MRNRFLQALACLSVLALAACAAPTAGSAADETALRAMGGKYADAFNKKDAAALAAMVTDDYQAVSPDGTEVKGKAAFEETEKQSAAGRTGMDLKLSVQTTIVKWAGADHAAIGGTWTMAGIPAGMGGDKGAWSGVAEKGADGQWRLATGMVAQYVPPPAAPMPTPAATTKPTPKPAPKPAAKKGKGK